MTAGPIAPGLALAVYQPATSACCGTSSVPSPAVPSWTSRVRTPMAGMTRKSGAGTRPLWDALASAAARPRGAATCGTGPAGPALTPVLMLSARPVRPPSATSEPASRVRSPAGRLALAACRPRVTSPHRELGATIAAEPDQPGHGEQQAGRDEGQPGHARRPRRRGAAQPGGRATAVRLELAARGVGEVVDPQVSRLVQHHERVDRARVQSQRGQRMLGLA